jgi:hypothetical protein
MGPVANAQPPDSPQMTNDERYRNPLVRSRMGLAQISDVKAAYLWESGYCLFSPGD